MNELTYLENFINSLVHHGIFLEAKQLKQFDTYAQMLQEWNQKMNLTAIVDLPGIYEKHFLDSILPSFDTKLEGRLCDVGAGAGFPSIPLKIIYPDLEVTIVEPLGKRITFLKALTSALDITIDLVNERAEDFAKMHREQYDVVTARAVANLAMLSELCIPLVKIKGIFLALKGSGAMEEYEESRQGIVMLGCVLRNVYKSPLTDGSTRINLEFYKECTTPKKYPRSFALIKKSPLKGGRK